MANSSLEKNTTRRPRRTVWLVGFVVGILIVAAGAAVWAFALNRSAPEPGSATGPRASVTASLTTSINQTVTGGTPKPTPLVAVAYGVVTSTELNLRLEASTTSPSLGMLHRGDIVPLARRSGGWYQTAEGGWLSALHLTIRQTRLEAESYAREIKTA